MDELTGQIERITFTNEENGYTVARVSVEGRPELVTVVGTLHDPTPGTQLKMRGEWTTHPKFGSQFKITEYDTVAPTTAAGIERYLAQGAVKGIGPVTAKQIVGRFGTETLKVMDEQIGRLREIPRIGRKRLEQITSSWQGQKEVREVMLFLEGNGVSPAYATKICRRYGKGAVTAVRKNPYRLANEIAGIGFATADRIAEALGYPRDGEQRTEAGLLHLLARCTDEGHLFLPAGELVRRGCQLLDIQEPPIEEVLARLAARRRIVVDVTADSGLLSTREPPPHGGASDRTLAADGRPGPGSAAFGASTPVYLPRLFDCEVTVAKKLLLLRRSRSASEEGERAEGELWGDDGGENMRLGSGRPEGVRREEAQPRGAKLGAEQRAAVRTALAHGMVVITGGPGTGKTTIIDVLARSLTEAGERVALAAPTGRAAKRMSEATGRLARTLHRLLEVDRGGGGFRRNAENPLDCDAVILDEVSMVDIPLMAALLAALPAGARLIMVGDADQLPSVGPGNLLADIIASKAVPVARLTEVYRQERDSGIISGAYELIRGRKPTFSSNEAGDFYFIEQEDPDRVANLIVTLVRERIPRRFGLDPLEEVQVLTPMNRGAAGTVNLNETLQGALNPTGAGLSRGTHRFRPGDKVMQIRNNYELDVFNGDIGRVVAADPEEGELTVDFDGMRVRYGAEILDELTLAYAITVHKAQGSEFPAVVIPLLTQHYLLLQRNLLYTAVTRGKRVVVIVGSSKALATAIRNDRTQKRNTALARRLQAGRF